MKDIDVPLEDFAKKGMAAQAAVDREDERQRQLDEIETGDARLLLTHLGSMGTPDPDSPKMLAIVKRWLKKHWSDGWKAAGGPSGAPGPEAYAKPPKKRKKVQS